jgi:hypothetical protein
VIETDGGNTLLLTEEEYFELARNMTPEDFQALLLSAVRKLDERLGLAEAATSKAITELKAARPEMAEAIREVKELKKRVAVLEELLRQPAVH